MNHIEVPLTQGVVALIDPEDEGRIVAHKWCAQRATGGKQLYAVATTSTKDGRARLFMHRFIINAPAGMDVDHINGDGLDNRKGNLRIVTRAQNSRNRRRLIAGTSSRFKGVCWHRRMQKWGASIFVSGRSIHLGSFDIEEEAARAYDRAAVLHFGEFACTNAELFAELEA